MKGHTVLRIRTITAFTSLTPSDFSNECLKLSTKIQHCRSLLQDVETSLTTAGYTVQTLRIATNPFDEWLIDERHQLIEHRLQALTAELQTHDIHFCSLGCTSKYVTICPQILQYSIRLSCSANMPPADVTHARRLADTIRQISNCDSKGLTNFRFAVVAAITPFHPFFPAASGHIDMTCGFAIGLENGHLLRMLLRTAKRLDAIQPLMRQQLQPLYQPIDDLCHSHSSSCCQYLGIDPSFNPSLDNAQGDKESVSWGGSVVAAIEQLHLQETFDRPPESLFGQHGTVAIVAELTQGLQTLDIRRIGFQGLMLPVLEDKRLAYHVATSTQNHYPREQSLSISKLLTISSVCGVGVDTVPLAGDCAVEDLTALILDVAAVAHRWKKGLVVRVLLCVGKSVGDWTDFESPYLCNTKVMDVRY